MDITTNITTNYKKYYQAIEPMMMKPKNRSYSTIIFFFLVLALFGWYAIRPTVQTILYLRREIADKRKLNVQMDEKINALIQAQSILETQKEALNLVGNAIPKDPQAMQLVKKLHEIANSSEASISGLQIGSVPVTEASGAALGTQNKKIGVTYVEFPITLAVSGSYQSISRFIDTVISLRRTFVVSSLSFTNNKGTKTLGPLQVAMKIIAYFETP